MRAVLFAALLLVGCKKPVGGAIACKTDGDCPAATPTCDLVSRVCVGCGINESACPTGMICDEAAQRCVPGSLPGCRFDQDCTFPTPVCIFAAGATKYGACKQCRSRTDCPQPDPPALPANACNSTTNVCERQCLCDAECRNAGYATCVFSAADAGTFGVCAGEAPDGDTGGVCDAGSI